MPGLAVKRQTNWFYGTLRPATVKILIVKIQDLLPGTGSFNFCEMFCGVCFIHVGQYPCLKGFGCFQLLIIHPVPHFFQGRRKTGIGFLIHIFTGQLVNKYKRPGFLDSKSQRREKMTTVNIVAQILLKAYRDTGLFQSPDVPVNGSFADGKLFL